MNHCIHIPPATATVRLLWEGNEPLDLCGDCASVRRKKLRGLSGVEFIDLRKQALMDAAQRVLSMKDVKQRAPINPLELGLVEKMAQQVRFPVGSAHKRFVHNLGEHSQLTDGGRRYLAFIAHRYRRQFKANEEEQGFIAKWNYERQTT